MQNFYPKNIAYITSPNRHSIHSKIAKSKGILGAFFQLIQKSYLQLFLVLCIGLLPKLSNATHIVGGVLTYVYNGSNNYTLSLVLYRDCAGAAYPGSAVVQIKQADGTTYGTLTLNPGTATNVPYTLDSCAEAPSPIPCVQKRTYTASITLPPTANGYHLYYSLCCRNSTLSNTTTSDQTTNQDGESFYAFIPGTAAWLEDFTLTNTTTTDTGATAWTRTLGTTAPGYANVQGNLFEISGANNAQATWTSQFIKTSSYSSGVNLSVDLAETSNLEANDSILVYYRLTSGGALTSFTTNGFRANDFGTATAIVYGLIADSVQIVIRVHYDGNSAGEIYRIDNVIVSNYLSNTTPTYTQFPPLFMCAGKAFTVDHSATDADGDSLYYSFYTPYSDAAPTFSGNVATFTPIIWNTGYSDSSPLNSGGPSLSLNSSIGLLTGTGNTIGQFQVGIKTTEYRNGVMLSEMVRDFQFNVINCPPPAQAYITAYGVTNGTLSVCSGSSLTFPNNSDPAATNWTWDFGDLTTTADVSTLQYPSYTYPGPGTYNVQMIINAGTSCADTSTAVVTVATPPATPTAAGATICQGSTATLTATAPGGTYQWYDAASGGTLLATNASYTTTTLTVTTTYYVQTTVSGCTSLRRAVTVTVTPTPAAPTAAGTTICNGSTATLTATAPGGTYQWYNAASGGTLLITNASYTTPTLTVTTTYYVQTTISGCVGPRTAVTVTVTPTPAAPTATGTGICQGTTATITATAPGGTYQWYDAASGGTLLITNASYTTTTLTVSTTYYVQTTVSGCAGSRTAVTVTVSPTPAAPTAAGSTICTNTTATLTATAPGGIYDWYTAASGGTLLATNASYTTPTLTVTTTYYVQATVAGCIGPRTAVTVTVSPVPAAPTASGTTVCNGSTATLTATAPGGTYDWYDAASGGTLLVTNASYTTPALSSNTTYYVQTTVAGCAGPRTAVTVTVTPTPVAPTASGTTICNGTTATLTATAPGGTYAWYDATSGGTLLVTNSIYTTPTLTVSTTYYVQTTVGGCAGPRTAVTVTVSPVPAAPTASGTTICQGTTASLTATAPGGTYAWYTAASGGTLLITNASYTTPTLTVSTTYYVQTTVAGCAGPRTAVTVTVTPTPATPTAAGTTICTGTSATLTATAPGGTYDWYTAASGGTLLTTNASYTTPTLTITTTYYVQSTVSGCVGPRTAVTVTVSPVPAAPTASGTTICTGTTATLTATAPGGTYAWYDAASGGILLITNANYTTPTLTVSTTYYVQTTVAGCAGPRTAVAVTVSPVPAAPTATGTTICTGTTATLTATAPGGTYAWYNAASGGTLLITNANYTTPTLTVTTTYYVQTTVAGCAGPRTAVTVTVSPVPAAPTASGTTICTNTTATLTATAPGGTYDWYDAASGGTLLATNASYTTPVLTANTTYYVQTTVAGCAGPRTAVTVTVSPIPAAPTAANTTICDGTTATLTATAPGGTYAWYDAASGATLLITNASYTTPVLSSNTTYYVQTTIAGCTGPRTAVTVIVNPIPAAPTASGTTICQSTTAILTATAPGGTYAWYDAATGGTLLITNASYTTPALTTTTTYYVQTTVGGCASATRTPVTVTVTLTPATPTAAGTIICNGSTATLTATAPGGTYDWYDAATGGTLLITNASYTTPVLSATTTYYVQTTIAGCASARRAVTVTVNPIPAAPTAAGATICDGNTATLTATAPGGTYQWYDAASGGTLLITNSIYTPPALSSNTTYYVQTTVSGCTGARTPVTVTVTPVPASPTATGTTICQSTTATLTATAPGGTYAWYTAATGGTLLITNASYTTPALASTTTYYVQTTVAGCASPRTAVTVTVTPTPATPTAAGTTICNGSTATLTATAPGGTYDWYDAASGGTLLITNASYTTPALASTTTYYVQTTVAGCASARRAVTVTVTPTDDPAFNYSSGTYCVTGSNPTPAITGGFPGTFSSSPAGLVLVSTSTGEINVGASTLNTYTVTYTTSGPCPSSSSTTVTITNAPDATFSYSGPYCQGTSNPSPTFGGGASAGVFSSSPAGLSFVSTNSGVIDLTTTTPGTYTVTNTIAAAGGCAAASNTASVTVNPAAIVNAGVSQSICAGTTATLAGTLGGAATSGTWTGGTGTFSLNTDLNAVYTPGVGETTAILTLTSNDPAGPCGVVSDTMIITINPIPAAPTAITDTVCSGSAATITATAPGGTYQWYSATSGGTLLATNTNYTTPTLTVTTTYYIQTTVSGCTSSSRTPVTVTVNPIPVAPTTAGTTICSGTAATITATAPGGTYDWYDAASGGTLLITNASYTTPTLTTTTTYYVQTTVAGCTGTRTAVTVTVNPIPVAPTAANATICSGNTATLTATAPGGTYAWYDAATAGTLLITNASYTTPTLTTTTTYYVQTTVAGCTSSSRTLVTVTVNPIPVAPTAAGTTICEGTTATVTATAPGGTYTWYTASTAGILLFTGANYTTATLTTTTTYYVQTTVSGCTSISRTPVTVTVNPTPAAPTTAGATICSGNTTTLTATAPGGTYDWYDAAVAGNLLVSNSSYTTPVLTTTTSYYVQTTIAGCAGPRTAVTVTVNPIPVVPTAANATICSGSTATLTATAPGGTYDWYDAASGGTLLITNASYTTPTLTTTTIYYVQTTVAGCTSNSRTAVTVTVNPIPAAPTASGTTICSGNTTTLTATAPGGTYTWYTAASGGTLLFTGANYTTTTLTTTTTYYVQTTVSGCRSASRTVVTVTVTPTDNPAFNYSSGTYCVTGTDPTPSITGGFPGGFSSFPAGLSLNTSNGTIDVSASTIGNYSVIYKTTGPCPASDTVSVTITNALNATFSYSGPFCSGSSNPAPTFSGGASAGVFSASPAGLVFVSTATGVINLTTTTPGTYTVTNNIAASGGCAAASHATTVTINPAATVNAGTDKTICAGTTITLAGTIGGAATSGTWSGGTGSFSSNTNLNAVYTPGVNETTATLTLTTNDPAGPCGAVSDIVVITIRKDTSSFNYSSGTYCISGTNPTPIVNGGYTGTFSSSPAGLVFLSTSTGELNLSGSTLNTYTVTFTTNGSCPDVSTANITVTNTPDATFSYAGPYCQNSTNPSPTFGGGASAGVFSASPAGLSFVSTTSGMIDLTTTAPGTYTITNTIAPAGGCAAASNTASVTVDPAAIVDAGANQSICAGTTATLAGILGGAATNGTWTGGTGTFSLNTDLNAVYTPGAGETTAILTLTSNDPAGPCAAGTDTMIITINPIPVAPTAAADTVCSGSAATLMATAPGGTYQWYTASSGGTLLITNASYTTPALTGNTTYYVQTTLSGCTSSSRTPVTVTVNPAPIVNANTNQTVCSNNAAVILNGSVTNAGGGTWTTSGNGIFTPDANTLNATYTPDTTDINAGNVMLFLTSTNNGGCAAVNDTMLITFSPAPIVNANVDQTLCKSSPVATLNGIVSGGATTGKWTTTGTGTFTPNDSTLNATYTPSTADTTAGTVTLILTSTNNGGCNPVKDTVVITYSNIPTVNAGNNQTVCANNATVVLNAISSTGTGIWSTSGGGTFTPNATTLNASYIPDAADTTAGTVTLTFTSTGGCTPVSKNITITITDAPVVNAGSNQFVCPSNLTVILSGNVSGGTSTGKWTTTGSGTFTPNDSTLNATYTMTTADTLAGNILLILTSSNNGNCSTVKDTITVTYTPAPIANAGTDLTACTNNFAQLNGIITGGSGTGTWTTPNGSGTFVPSNTTLNTMYIPNDADTLVGNIILILTSTTSGGCAASSDTVIVTVNPGPTVNAGTDQTTCSNNVSINLSGTVTVATGGKWTTSGDGTFSPNDSTLNATYQPGSNDITTGTITLVLTSTGNAQCAAVTDTVLITIDPAPQVNAGTDMFICSGIMTTLLNGTITGNTTTGKWTTLGTGTFTPTDSTLNATYTFSSADTAAGSITLILTSTNNGNCLSVTDTVVVNINPVPSVAAGKDTSICANATLVLNGIIGGGAGTGKWTTTGTGIFSPDDSTLTATYTPSVTDITTGSVKLILTATQSCALVQDSIIVTLDAAPTVNAGTNSTICAGSAATLNGNITVASGAQWTSSGTGTFTPNNTTLNPTYTPSAADITLGTVKLFLTTTGNGNCNTATDSIIITIQSKPIANFTNPTVCLNTNVTFTDASSGTIVNWAWDFGNGTSTQQNPTNLFTSTGSKPITLIIATSAGCADTITKNIFVNALPTAAFTFQTFCPDSTEFTDASTMSPGTIKIWNWNFGDSTSSSSQNPRHTYTSAGSYLTTLLITSDSGCVASKLDTVIIKPCDDITNKVNDPKVPTAFTPNGDGHNDILYVKGGPFTTISFRVFNEWGNEIFNSTSQAIGWDGTFKGKAQPTGTYVWTIIGTTLDNKEIKMVGGVTLIR